MVARGGMARVYRARDVRLDRDVALKILSAPYTHDPGFARRFLAEARSVAALSHPNLVHVYDSGVDGQLRYIVMELLEGYRPLRTELARHERLDTGDAVRIAEEILSGLRVVHEHGLVHCDVKAGNVMVGPGPTKLIDFGIARAPHAVTDEATSLGSLHAMPPEQLRGDDLTAASDLFALGAVLYIALTGRVPYPGDNPDEVVASQQVGRPAAPSALAPGIGPTLDAVVLQALEPEPSLRFESAAAMARALDVAAGEVAGARHTDQTTRIVRVPQRSRPVRHRARHRWLVPLMASLALAIAAVVAVGILLNRPSVLPGAGTGASQSVGATATPTLRPGTVRVPDTIGLTEAQAEAVARASLLRWTIQWRESADHAPGIYDQEPAAGELVDNGSRFTMYAYRPAH